MDIMKERTNLLKREKLNFTLTKEEPKKANPITTMNEKFYTPKRQKRVIKVWHITLPLSIVLVCFISSLTTIYMNNGHYTFEWKINHEGLVIKNETNKTQK